MTRKTLRYFTNGKMEKICHSDNRKQMARSKSLTKIILMNGLFSEVQTGLKKQQGVKGPNTGWEYFLRRPALN